MNSRVHRGKIVGSGTSTGQMLRALGDAILRPGEPVAYKDHFQPTTYNLTAHNREVLKHIIQKLGLRDIAVVIQPDGFNSWEICIKSQFRGLQKQAS